MGICCMAQETQTGSSIFKGPSILFSEKAMATHSGILAWKIAWAEEPGGLESEGPQRVEHN